MQEEYIVSGANKIAVKSTLTQSANHIIFCGGFKSNMEGSKAIALENFCQNHKVSYTRFDYSGHGISEGKFSNGNIDSWLNDTLRVIDSHQHTQKLILIGSSMGAWIATLAAEKRPANLAALVTIAAAPDFTERLLLPFLNEDQLESLRRNNPVLLPSEYDDGSPYPITAQLIANSEQHCLLSRVVDIDVPVRLLHGIKDRDVPFDLSIDLMRAIRSNDIRLSLIKNGDHRLSSTEHLLVLEQTLIQLLDQLNF